MRITSMLRHASEKAFCRRDRCSCLQKESRTCHGYVTRTCHTFYVHFDGIKIDPFSLSSRLGTIRNGFFCLLRLSEHFIFYSSLLPTTRPFPDFHDLTRRLTGMMIRHLSTLCALLVGVAGECRANIVGVWILTTSVAAADSNVSVVCVPGECIQGTTNITSASPVHVHARR